MKRYRDNRKAEKKQTQINEKTIRKEWNKTKQKTIKKKKKCKSYKTTRK